MKKKKELLLFILIHLQLCFVLITPRSPASVPGHPVNRFFSRSFDISFISWNWFFFLCFCRIIDFFFFRFFFFVFCRQFRFSTPAVEVKDYHRYSVPHSRVERDFDRTEMPEDPWRRKLF